MNEMGPGIVFKHLKPVSKELTEYYSSIQAGAGKEVKGTEVLKQLDN